MGFAKRELILFLDRMTEFKQAGHADKRLDEIWRVDSLRREAATNED